MLPDHQWVVPISKSTMGMTVLNCWHNYLIHVGFLTSEIRMIVVGKTRGRPLKLLSPSQENK